MMVDWLKTLCEFPRGRNQLSELKETVSPNWISIEMVLKDRTNWGHLTLDLSKFKKISFIIYLAFEVLKQPTLNVYQFRCLLGGAKWWHWPLPNWPLPIPSFLCAPSSSSMSCPGCYRLEGSEAVWVFKLWVISPAAIGEQKVQHLLPSYDH